MRKRLLEQQREIERLRQELNVAALRDIRGMECYQISIKLDQLIADYMGPEPDPKTSQLWNWM